FFFQAEDGIRDRNVTGVQTCALPISFHHILSVRVSPHFSSKTIFCRESTRMRVTTFSNNASSNASNITPFSAKRSRSRVDLTSVASPEMLLFKAEISVLY